MNCIAISCFFLAAKTVEEDEVMNPSVLYVFVGLAGRFFSFIVNETFIALRGKVGSQGMPQKMSHKSFIGKNTEGDCLCSEETAKN